MTETRRGYTIQRITGGVAVWHGTTAGSLADAAWIVATVDDARSRVDRTAGRR